MSKRTRAFLKVGLAFAIWSFLGPLLNLSSFTAMQTIWTTSILAILALLLFATFRRELHLLRVVSIDVKLFLFILSSGLSGVLWLYSLTVLPIAQAVLLYNMAPSMTLILGFFVLKEEIRLLKILVLLLGFIGIGIILAGNLGRISWSSPFLLGNLLVLTAAAFTATQAVIAKRFSTKYSTWINVLLVMLSEAIIAAPFAFLASWKITPFAIGSILFLSIFSSIVAFALYMGGFAVLRSSTVTLVGYIEPLLAVIWGFMFLRQSLTPHVVLGGIFILLAGYIAMYVEEERDRPEIPI